MLTRLSVYTAGTKLYMHITLNTGFICLPFLIFLVYFCCRHILAAIHFNFNLMRKRKQSPDGSSQIKLTYPKFKDGTATVRDIREKQNFGKFLERLHGEYNILV